MEKETPHRHPERNNDSPEAAGENTLGGYFVFANEERGPDDGTHNATGDGSPKDERIIDDPTYIHFARVRLELRFLALVDATMQVLRREGDISDIVITPFGEWLEYIVDLKRQQADLDDSLDSRTEFREVL